ncbi:MAG: LLM class flavin-dependent oxidoreductase [Enhydrobacter sp.]|nr:MAG: LLM class flavin-dependent oxidoreductase [Enhydrobacter sp.]
MKIAVFDHMDRSGAPAERQYEDRLRLAELYEEAGFYAYHVAEHHGTPLGMAPSPGLFLAALAQRTTRLRFGPMVYPLGLYHPVRLIEEICMLDLLSGGRLEVGVGRGASPYEASFFGVDPKTGPDRFGETLDILLKGLGARRLDHRGKFFLFKNVPLQLQPLQRPRPPLWVATRSIESVPQLARQGCNIALSLPVGEVADFTARYRAAWARLGRDPEEMPFVGATRNVVVGDDDRDAVAIARRAFHVWYGSLVHLWKAHGLDLPRQIFPADFDEAAGLGYVVAGSPATVRERLRADDHAMGINYSLCRFAYGDLSYDEAARSVRLFAREVMPALESRYGSRDRAALGGLVKGVRWVGGETLSDVAIPFR